MKRKSRVKFQAQKAPTEIPHEGFGYPLEKLPKIRSLFLVISYDKKYSKVETAIRNFFGDIYSVCTARDCMAGLLEGICEKIKEVDFGIVVLAGLKKFKKVRNKKRYYVKMNIPFEYGMLQISGLPVMLLCEEDLNLDIKTEFSDISNIQYGEKFKCHRYRKKIERRIGEVFKKFIPELAKKRADKAFDEVKELGELAHSKVRTVKSKLRIIYETQIKSDFREKII